MVGMNGLPRGVVKALEVNGYHIPAGTQVRLSPAAGQRLPRMFRDPDAFDPDRFARRARKTSARSTRSSRSAAGAHLDRRQLRQMSKSRR